MANQIKNTDNDDLYKVRLLISKYKHWWKWFVLSVFLCSVIAVGFIYFWPKGYQRIALVMIRDDSKRTDISAALGDKFVVSMSSNVKNEVEAFRSPKLIQDVLTRLNLTTQYSVSKKMRKEYLYHLTPVIASFPDAKNDDFFEFRIQLEPNNKVILSKFENQGKRTDAIFKKNLIKGNLEDTLSTPIGRVVLKKTVHFENLGYTTITVEKNAIQKAAEAFGKSMSASLVSKDNSIIQLDVTTSSIARAEDFLNELITVYNENWMLEKNSIAQSTSDFFNKNLPLIKRQFDSIATQLELYKRQNPLTNVQSSATLIMNQSSNYTARILELKTQMAMTQFIKDNMRMNDNIYTMIPSGISNLAIESQIAQYNTVLNERNGLMLNSSEKNEAVQKLNTRLESLRQSIVQAVENNLVTLEMQLTNLQAQETRMTGQIASNPILERQLAIIEREYKTIEDLYMYMAKKKEENDMSLILETSNTRIISPPAGAEKPVKPQKFLFCLIGVFVGLVVPTGFIWGKESTNITIRGKSDLDGLSVPFLGVIALANNEVLKNGLSVLVSETGRDNVNETFRMVRTSMDAICGKDMKVIMFTSFEPGCGKTFVALNLAMSFAIAGKKVALIDTDMRKATLSKITDWSDHAPEKTGDNFGICDFLSGKHTRVQFTQFGIRKNRYYDRFDIYPIGEIPPNPAELLMSSRFKKMLENIKSKYNYVFIDCTPLDVVTDAEIVSKLADLSVFIVREECTYRKTLHDIENVFERGQLGKKELSDKLKNLEEKRKIEERDINRREKVLLAQFESDSRRIKDNIILLNEQKKIAEQGIRRELKELDDQRKPEKQLKLHENDSTDEQKRNVEKKNESEQTIKENRRIEKEEDLKKKLISLEENRIKKESELNTELEELYKQNKLDIKGLKDERKEIKEQKILDEKQLDDERIPFEEMALILNGHKADIAYNKHHTRFHEEVREVTKQIRASELVRQISERTPKDEQSEVKRLPSKRKKTLLLTDGKQGETTSSVTEGDLT